MKKVKRVAKKPKYWPCVHCNVFVRKSHGVWVHDDGEKTYTDCRLAYQAMPNLQAPTTREKG